MTDGMFKALLIGAGLLFLIFNEEARMLVGLIIVVAIAFAFGWFAR